MFMQNAPDPTALDQISLLIKRYNQLTLEINQTERLQNMKDEELAKLKVSMSAEISSLKSDLHELRQKIEVATKIKSIIGKEFKHIVKIDTLNRLSRRIDQQNYENRISRQELYRLLERR